MPLSQFVLADTLGLTSIQVNRTLRQLRERKLLSNRQGFMTWLGSGSWLSFVSSLNERD
jgi:hypothetical protein